MHVIHNLAAYLFIQISYREPPEALYSSHCTAPVLNLQQHLSISIKLPGRQALNSFSSLAVSNCAMQSKQILLIHQTRKKYTTIFYTILQVSK